MVGKARARPSVSPPSCHFPVFKQSSTTESAPYRHIGALEIQSGLQRECHIHVICLVEDPNASVFTTDAWITLIRHRTDLPPTDITLLSATQDLQADMPTTPGMRQLHTVIRDASMQGQEEARHVGTLTAAHAATAGHSILFQDWRLLRIPAQA